MRTHGRTPVVGTVNDLEVGDMIAFAFVGSITSGKIMSLPSSRMGLTTTQMGYLKGQNVKIPENDWECIGGPSNRLLLGDFYAPGVHFEHMFLDWRQIVVVFPKEK